MVNYDQKQQIELQLFVLMKHPTKGIIDMKWLDYTLNSVRGLGGDALSG